MTAKYNIKTYNCDKQSTTLSVLILEFGRPDLEELIKHNASVLYNSDKNCPLTYEPSGFDFLSPCTLFEFFKSKVGITVHIEYFRRLSR